MKKSLARTERLKKAGKWLKSYPGQKPVKAYARHYGVDKICAIKELRMLGVEISVEYEKAISNTIDAIYRQKERRKMEREQKCDPPFESDENFAYIAGYTSGGAAYGISHEEWKRLKKDCET
jgi:outer membrane receptor for Fe3+-dicitrate